jgi:hypothetical protein
MEGPPKPPEIPGKLGPGDSAMYMYSGFNDNHWKESIPPKMEPTMSNIEKELVINKKYSIFSRPSTENTVGAYGAEVPSVASNSPLEPPERQTVFTEASLNKASLNKHKEWLDEYNEWLDRYIVECNKVDEWLDEYIVVSNERSIKSQQVVDALMINPDASSAHVMSSTEAHDSNEHEPSSMDVVADNVANSGQKANEDGIPQLVPTQEKDADDTKKSNIPTIIVETIPTTQLPQRMSSRVLQQADMYSTNMPKRLPPSFKWRVGKTKTTTPKKVVRKKDGKVKAVTPKKVIRKKSDQPNTETPTPNTTRPPQCLINIVLQQIAASVRVFSIMPFPPPTTTTMMWWKGGRDKFVIPKKSVRKKFSLFDSTC